MHKPFATLLHLDYLQHCCTNGADGLHPAKTWRSLKFPIISHALENKRKLFLSYLLRLRYVLAYY